MGHCTKPTVIAAHRADVVFALLEFTIKMDSRTNQQIPGDHSRSRLMIQMEQDESE